MRPAYHMVASGAFGIPIYFFSGSLIFTGCFAATGVAVDLDHFVDHCFFSNRPLRFKKFFQKGLPLTYSRLVFALHSYEFLFICILIALRINSPSIWGVTVGWLFHLLLDEISNRLPSEPHKLNLFFYFFTFRLLRGFRVNKISWLRKPGRK